MDIMLPPECSRHPPISSIRLLHPLDLALSQELHLEAESILGHVLMAIRRVRLLALQVH